MAGENTIASMNGLFKTVYAKKLINAVPNFALLQDLVEFVPAEKETGAYYAQPVALSQEAGFTYNGTSGAVVSLKSAKNAIMKEAQVYGSELILRSQMAYAVLTRASKKGEKAFERATSWKIFDMNNSIRKRLEIGMLYGQSGLGTVSTVTDLGGGVAELVMTDATWAGGIWAGAEGATLDAFTGTTKNNASGVLTITKVDSDLKKLTVSYSGTLASEVAAADVLFYEGANAGAGSFNEMAGLHKIVSNTGTLFNIDASQYSLWKGSTKGTVGSVTFPKIQDAVALAVNKGLMEKAVVLVSPKAWGVLNSEQSALRQFDKSYSKEKLENGGEALTFHSSNGILEVRSHPLVKDGDAFVLPVDSIIRIGATDVTFGLPTLDDQFMSWVPGSNAVELQCMADQAIFLEKPAQAVYLSGLTYP